MNQVRTVNVWAKCWCSFLARVKAILPITHHSSLITLVLALASPLASALVPVPPLRSPITDLTGTLSASQIASLDQSLRAFERQKGAQVAVLLVPTTEPETIEQYSLRVAETWKLGREKPDDGVLFLIAKNDRAMRIEVGYGLEGALTDVAAKRIIRDVVTPHFRAGEFYLGIVAGTDHITKIIAGEPLPEPTFVEQARRPQTGIGSGFIMLVMGCLVIGRIVRAVFGRFFGALITGAGAGVILWFVFGVLAVTLGGALIAFIITLLNSSRGGYWGGGGSWGGSSGRSWGGGGGGGWSGGGGGFGGGGASGRW